MCLFLYVRLYVYLFHPVVSCFLDKLYERQEEGKEEDDGQGVGKCYKVKK